MKAELYALTASAAALVLVAVACAGAAGSTSAAPVIPEVAAGLALWPRLLQQEPYPYTTPLPPAEVTALDGTYSKLDPREGARPFCKRCMPYPAEGGLWLLQLDRASYRILSARSLSGWRSLGSYTVSGDQLVLFNDPHCMEDVGVYRWELVGDHLVLELVEDPCADGWRGITFTNYDWVIAD